MFWEHLQSFEERRITMKPAQKPLFLRDCPKVPHNILSKIVLYMFFLEDSAVCVASLSGLLKQVQLHI